MVGPSLVSARELTVPPPPEEDATGLAGKEREGLTASTLQSSKGRFRAMTGMNEVSKD